MHRYFFVCVSWQRYIISGLSLCGTVPHKWPTQSSVLWCYMFLVPAATCLWSMLEQSAVQNILRWVSQKGTFCCGFIIEISVSLVFYWLGFSKYVISALLLSNLVCFSPAQPCLLHWPEVSWRGEEVHAVADCVWYLDVFSETKPPVVLVLKGFPF